MMGWYNMIEPGEWTNRHQMSVNNKRDDFTKEDLLTMIIIFSINHKSGIFYKIPAALLSHCGVLHEQTFSYPHPSIHQDR